MKVNVTWEEFLVANIDLAEPPAPKVRMLAACAAVHDAFPDAWQRFNQAMLTLLFEEKDDPRKDTTLLVAARVAGIPGEDVVTHTDDVGLELLVAGSAEARKLGVTAVPTVMHNGPPVHITTTAAANYGNAVYRLELINRMLRDDGIWSMTKP